MIGDAESARALYFNEYRPREAEFTDLVEDLGVAAEAAADRAEVRMETENRAAMRRILWSLVLGLLSVLGIFTFVGVRTSRILARVTERASRLSTEVIGALENPRRRWLGEIWK